LRSSILTPSLAARGTVASKALSQIDGIFRLEDSYKELSAEERLERRKAVFAPLVDAFLEKNTMVL
jgi:hypothetical protein